MSVDGTGFPFAAVVGMDDVKLALLLGALEPRLGGVLLRGEKGSAKTTLARGLAELLPGGPPFVELPLGATEDRVVGTLDLAAALTGGERRFHPGLLQAADGGVLYVDEVNLLADHLVDVLLDVAVSGVNRVEREGVSFVHRSRFLLVGSMNPEEGELRPQLLDRFGLSVEVAAPRDPALRSEAVRRRLAFDASPEEFRERWAGETERLRRQVARASTAPVPDAVVEAAARLAHELGADGLRAELSCCRAAGALAALEGREEATLEDLRRVAPLCFAHRRRRGPFDEPGVSPEEIDEVLDAPAPEPGGGELGAKGDDTEPPDPPEPPDLAPVPIPPPAASRPVVAPGRNGGSRGPGARIEAGSGRGRVIGSRPAGAETSRIAVGATVIAAAERRAARPSGAAPETALVEAADLREAVAVERRSHLVVLCVDTSGSMGAAERFSAARSAVLSLLTDAYQRRDRVAVVCFSGDGARVLLRPTGSVEVARERLAAAPTGGRTPLADGILAALDLCTAPSARELAPVLVLVSDGRATASAGDGVDPVAAALEAGRRVARSGVQSLVVDVESGPMPLGVGAELAAAMGGRHVVVNGTSGRQIDEAVRSLLGDP